MTTRREFLKKSMLLSGAAGVATAMPASILRALAIDPAPGSTFLDAEHVVILMQENRSFDHCFGTLRGVRGFNDPRAIRLANGNPVWFQTNAQGKTYAPFRLNIKDTKATWMGSLPHSRASQTDARNEGRYDQWLNACAHHNKQYAPMPLTLGYYNRDDLPFNYALADAFTVCDQNFCSALTSTWPNRHYLWSGTIRNEQDPASRARIRNDLDFGEAKWHTFPERLEEHGISWRVYQNDLTCGGGLEGEERAWLTNYTCNPLEYFERYQVKFFDRYVDGLRKQVAALPAEIQELETISEEMDRKDTAFQKYQTALRKKREVLNTAETELARYNEKKFHQLSPTERNLFEKAFATNKDDPDFRSIATLEFRDGEEDRKMTVPKGDLFHRFRKDVNHGQLPTVSWLVSPQRFSDHPSAPWYGAWYVSEVLDILTANPEIWKKTIFILTYDENDGYFDHVPPFVPPDPSKPHSGKCSNGIKLDMEYVPLKQELDFGIEKKAARGGPIGLGYRVPMIIASPWSRGGRVNSQVFDHTSVLRFLEVFLSNKQGKPIREPNISAWRRTVCGDLTSVFAEYQPKAIDRNFLLDRDRFVKTIYSAQFKQEPDGFREVTSADLSRFHATGSMGDLLPRQEGGVRPSCALPYQLYADGNWNAANGCFEILFQAKSEVFGDRTAGSPFTVYAPVAYRGSEAGALPEQMRNWQFAVAAGDALSDAWPIKAFAEGRYHLQVFGPNGFFREYSGDEGDPELVMNCIYEGEGAGKTLSGNIVLAVDNKSSDKEYLLEIVDHMAPQSENGKVSIRASATIRTTIKSDHSFGWYDFSVSIDGAEGFKKRYAGRVETGKEGFSDPSIK